VPVFSGALVPGIENLLRTRVRFELHVRDATVPAEGVKELAPLDNATALHLPDTRVTDAGLKELVAIENLTALDLCQTAVTDAGVDAFRRAVPRCAIR
jgi:hypothetical protein